MLDGILPLENLQTNGRDTTFLTCHKCKAYENANTPAMPTYGENRKNILIVGGFPGLLEDKKGKPWENQDGKLLFNTFLKAGIDIFRDGVNIYSMSCYPGFGKNPTDHEIACCRRNIFTAIKQHKPKYIVLVGLCAVKSVIGDHWQKDLGSMEKWRGWTIPDQNLGAFVCPIYDPNFVLERNADTQQTYNIWYRDIMAIGNLVKQKAFVKKLPEPNIEIIPEGKIYETLRFLNNPKNYSKAPILAFDYETTGIKPHRPGHRIVCTSFSTGKRHFVIPEIHLTGDKRAFKRLLTNPKILKTAHNLKFEETWTQWLYGFPVSPWGFDSLLGCHVMDNRKSITSLKFLSYVMLGIRDYSLEVEPFLKSGSKNNNAFNGVLVFMKTPMGREKLFKYCGYDSIYQRILAFKIAKTIGWPICETV